jgi:hypothetical protein
VNKNIREKIDEKDSHLNNCPIDSRRDYRWLLNTIFNYTVYNRSGINNTGAGINYSGTILHNSGADINNGCRFVNHSGPVNDCSALHFCLRPQIRRDFNIYLLERAKNSRWVALGAVC